jgi:hypothetical protein
MGSQSGTCHVEERKEGGLTGERWVADIGSEPTGVVEQPTRSVGEPKWLTRGPNNYVGF